MNVQRLCVVVGLMLVALLSQAAEPRADEGSPKWDLQVLGQAPKFEPAQEPTATEVQSIFFEGVPFQKKPTKVFAYYGLPKGLKPGEKAPGIVLVHGGGGTAFDRWVRLWNSRGYAAIAPDLCGCVPIGSYGKWQRHEAGGPPGWGGFNQIDWPQQDQWTWQAVANVILAHSLLRSLPEVDAERIGLTGISWGGYLTCITASIDSRFRFAAPVYGCGFLGDNSAWLGTFKSMPEEKSARWLRWWDPSVYLSAARMPMLWVTGTNDFAYPMDSLQKSYRLPQSPRTICLRVRMPHGHGSAGENPAEIHAFADSILKGGVPLARITAQGRDDDQVWATYQSNTPIRRAELNYTCQTGVWKERKWETVPATVIEAQKKVTAQLPNGVTVYYLNLVDERGLVVSTEHEVVEKE
jgi:cephalosporin-C deacetylase-like acetyl esterase